METLERAARRLSIEGSGRHLTGTEIVKQGAGDGGLADATLVGTDEKDSWFGHDTPSGIRDRIGDYLPALLTHQSRHLSGSDFMSFESSIISFVPTPSAARATDFPTLTRRRTTSLAGRFQTGKPAAQ